MIPKLIHYCWFGGKPKGELIEDCINSWKKMLPGYKIIEWNEGNYSADNFFYRYAITNKRFAFASDYARFDILSKQGGIYLDTDMLLLKSLDPFLNHSCFFGYEDKKHVSCGIIGAEAQQPFIAAIKKELDAVSSNDSFINYTIVKTVNKVYESFSVNAKATELPVVYPVPYFYPFPYKASGDPMQYRKNETVAIHLWNASWFNTFNRAELLHAQGKTIEARRLYFKSLLQQPKNIRYFFRFMK